MKKIRLVVALLFLGCVSNVQAAIIGVDIEAGQGSPTNWTSYTLGDVGTTLAGLVAEDGSATSVGFQLDGVTFIQNVPPSSTAVIPTHSNDITTACCDILAGGPNPTLATWSGLTPFATYNYWVFTSSTAPNDVITVTGDTVDVFNSVNAPASGQAINGILGDNTLTFASYARQVQASATGTIVIGIQSGGSPTPSGYALEEIVVTTEAIPTMSVWSIGLLSMLLGLIGFSKRRMKFLSKK